MVYTSIILYLNSVVGSSTRMIKNKVYVCSLLAYVKWPQIFVHSAQLQLTYNLMESTTVIRFPYKAMTKPFV